MRRLLRANFARLLKNKLFWILTCAELFLGALFPILHYMDNIDENSGWNMDSTIFIYALFVPLMVSLLTALFIGTDYSDGTMRNKLIAGHVRRKIYVANLISNVQASFTLCVAFMLSHVCVGTPLLGWFVSDAHMLMFYVLVTLTMTAACTAIFTLISMLCSNKAYSVAGCILVIFMLLQVYLFLNEFLPGGQMLRLSSMNAKHLGRYAIYNSIIFIFTTSCGILIFKRKDLK